MEALDITAKTAKGNIYKVVSYVDPFPGRKGSDRIFEDCGKCSGTGVINYGGVTLVKGGVEDRWCFQCGGTGKYSFLVSSARSTARRQAKAQTLRNAESADHAAEYEERLAAEKEAAHKAALQEEARREAKPKGFLGIHGERLRNLNARVEMTRGFEGEDHFGRPEMRWLVKFDVGGRTAVWFTSNPGSLEEGQFVSLTGTVKKINTRDGEDQTVLTRCVTK